MKSVSVLDMRCVVSLILYMRRAKCLAEYAGNGRVVRKGPWDFREQEVRVANVIQDEYYITSPEIPSGGYTRDVGTTRILDLAEKLGLVKFVDETYSFVLTDLGQRIQTF